MTQWKPMHTAPKNGTHILLAIGGKAIEGWWDKDGGWFDDHGNNPGDWAVVSLNSHGCGCCSYQNPEPTGWMRLPA